MHCWRCEDRAPPWEGGTKRKALSASVAPSHAHRASTHMCQCLLRYVADRLPIRLPTRPAFLLPSFSVVGLVYTCTPRACAPAAFCTRLLYGANWFQWLGWQVFDQLRHDQVDECQNTRCSWTHGSNSSLLWLSGFRHLPPLSSRVGRPPLALSACQRAALLPSILNTPLRHQAPKRTHRVLPERAWCALAGSAVGKIGAVQLGAAGGRGAPGGACSVWFCCQFTDRL